MPAKKTFLKILVINTIVLSLLSKVVTTQSITQDSHEKYQATFDLEIVDAFTNRPLSGGLAIYAVCNDTL